MLKKKFFSFQYLSSDRLHQINFSVINIAVSFSVILAIIIGANYYLSLEFSNQYYKDQLRETDAKYADVSQELLKYQEEDGAFRVMGFVPIDLIVAEIIVSGGIKEENSNENN